MKARNDPRRRVRLSYPSAVAPYTLSVRRYGRLAVSNSRILAFDSRDPFEEMLTIIPSSCASS
jgi:hypothetical protein